MRETCPTEVMYDKKALGSVGTANGVITRTNTFVLKKIKKWVAIRIVFSLVLACALAANLLISSDLQPGPQHPEDFFLEKIERNDRPVLAIVVAVRPNYMKAAPILLEIQRQNLDWDTQIIHTGQHFDKSMSDSFFEQLHMPRPTVNLNIGLANQGTEPIDQLFETQLKLRQQFQIKRPDLVIVIGDVSSTLACAHTAWGMKIPIMHLESGLRSKDKTLPEEMNRIVTDQMSSYFLVTEPTGIDNLLSEGIVTKKDDGRRFFYVGNPMIDTVLRVLDETSSYNSLEKFGVKSKEYILATFHRQDNVDTKESLAEVLDLLKHASEIAPVILSVHPRTLTRLRGFGMMSKLDAISSLDHYTSLSYVDFTHLERSAMLVLTDSGGVQEETTALGVPCITVRPSTERPTTVTQGTNYVIPRQQKERILSLIKVANKAKWEKAGRVPLYWDGEAGVRTVHVLKQLFNNGIKNVQTVPLGIQFPRSIPQLSHNLSEPVIRHHQHPPQERRFLVMSLDSSLDPSRIGISGGFLWIYNTLRVLSSMPNTQVDLLPHFRIPAEDFETNEKFRMLKSLDSVTILDSYAGKPGSHFGAMNRNFNKKLTGKELAAVLQHLKSHQCYDAIILRYIYLYKENYLEPLVLNTNKQPALSKFWVLSFENSLASFAQKHGAIKVVQSPFNLTGSSTFDPQVHPVKHKEVWMPPMIEHVYAQKPRSLEKSTGITFCYFGAWSPKMGGHDDFLITDALEAICQLNTEMPGKFAFLIAIGAGTRPSIDFKRKAAGCKGVTLFETPIGHNDTMNHYANTCDLGVQGLKNANKAWHISTKVIEMAANGLPIVMNRFPIHEKLFGPSYPLWWDGEKPVESFVLLAKEILREPDKYTAASSAVIKMSQKYTFDSVGAQWSSTIQHQNDYGGCNTTSGR